jgi:hypothetical protein
LSNDFHEQQASEQLQHAIPHYRHVINSGGAIASNLEAAIRAASSSETFWHRLPLQWKEDPQQLHQRVAAPARRLANSAAPAQ